MKLTGTRIAIDCPVTGCGATFECEIVVEPGGIHSIPVKDRTDPLGVSIVGYVDSAEVDAHIEWHKAQSGLSVLEGKTE